MTIKPQVASEALSTCPGSMAPFPPFGLVVPPPPPAGEQTHNETQQPTKGKHGQSSLLSSQVTGSCLFGLSGLSGGGPGGVPAVRSDGWMGMVQVAGGNERDQSVELGAMDSVASARVVSDSLLMSFFAVSFLPR